MVDAGTSMHLLLPLVIGFLIGVMLGLEREMSPRPAGLRTQVLVTVGTTIFVLAARSLGQAEVGRISANVVTGLGFLGAGVILQHRGAVRGLTTAALIWVNGALGLAVALEKYLLAASGVVLTLTALRLLGAVERKMATKCRVLRYEVTARENEELLGAVHQELGSSHFQEGPLAFDRREGKIFMRFGLCNPPRRHQQFVEKLRKIPDVFDLKVE